MALRGTLDSFGLPDVLRLIESTGKSGALHVISESMLGTIWIDESKVVASETSIGVPAGEHASVLFQLLCLTNGEFEFINGESPPASHSPMALAELIAEAEEQLIEWDDIQSVLPSLDSHLHLATQLSASEVLLDSGQWKLIVAVGMGSTASALGEELSIAQIPLCRQLKELVEIGVLEVLETESETGILSEDDAEDSQPEELVTEAEQVSPVDDPGKLPENDVIAADVIAEKVVGEAELTEESAAQEVAAAELEEQPEDESEDGGLDAVERLKARIEAVKGVTDSAEDVDAEATIASMTDDTVEFESEEAAPGDGLFPASGDPDADEINRGTLLKFLSSVRS